VSLSFTLGRNEKVEQYIRNKTHKPNALRFWVEGGVILLYGFGSRVTITDDYINNPKQNTITKILPYTSAFLAQSTKPITCNFDKDLK